MSNGNLGKLVSTGGVYENVYEVPALNVQFATCFIYGLNPTGSEVAIKIAISTMATPAGYDHIQGEVNLDANGGTYEFPAMLCHPGEKVLVWSDAPGIVFNVRGIEQS